MKLIVVLIMVLKIAGSYAIEFSPNDSFGKLIEQKLDQCHEGYTDATLELLARECPYQDPYITPVSILENSNDFTYQVFLSEADKMNAICRQNILVKKFKKQSVCYSEIVKDLINKSGNARKDKLIRFYGNYVTYICGASKKDFDIRDINKGFKTDRPDYFHIDALSEQLVDNEGHRMSCYSQAIFSMFEGRYQSIKIRETTGGERLFQLFNRGNFDSAITRTEKTGHDFSMDLVDSCHYLKNYSESNVCLERVKAHSMLTKNLDMSQCKSISDDKRRNTCLFDVWDDYFANHKEDPSLKW